MATPTISSVTGTYSHGASVTVNGANFETKATAAPIIWDNCNHGGLITDRWSGAWPNAVGNDANNMNYRAAQRNISMPHARTGKYMCGSHNPGLGADEGYTVMCWKNSTFSEGRRSFMSWYQRMDDNWTFGLGSPVDDNLKHWDYSEGTSPYSAENYYTEWYDVLGGGPKNTADVNKYHINDDDTTISGGDFFGAIDYINPFSGVWTKQEMFMLYSTTSGIIQLVENGVLKLSYSGPTDLFTGTARNESIGGYARSQGSTNNWRYFCDLYVDDCYNSVSLGNASTRGACTRIEYQTPTAWSDTAVTFTGNLGAFGDNDIAWLYVRNASGVINSTGFSVQLGSGVAAVSSSAPVIPSSHAKYGRLQRIPK